METIVIAVIVIVIVLVVAMTLRERRAVAARSAKPGPPRPELSAERLARELDRGVLPDAHAVGFPLRHGEVCVGIAEADVEQWFEGDGTYIEKHVLWAGGLVGLVLGSIFSAAGNARRRAEAEREAAERWRLVGRYRVYVTTRRIALEGNPREWHEFDLDDIRSLEVEREALVMQAAGGWRAVRLHVAPVDYWHVLLRRLTVGERPGRSPWSLPRGTGTEGAPDHR